MKNIYKSGKVRVNGIIVNKLGTTINPNEDSVEFENKPIIQKHEKKIYILLNKPIDYVTTAKDQFRKKNCLRFNQNKRKNYTSW